MFRSFDRFQNSAEINHPQQIFERSRDGYYFSDRISYDIYKKLKETATEYVIVLHFIEKETKRKEKKKKNTRECEKSVSTIPLLGRYCIDVTVNIFIKNSNAHKILHR